MIRKLLGIAPRLDKNGGYTPSPIALKLATSSITNFDGTIYQNPYKKDQLKILILCTEEQHMTMTNGKKFSTGNHPVETMVPMIHFKNAGFDMEIFTPSGKSVKLEKWAMPQKDENVKAIYDEYKSRFESPQNLADFVNKEMDIADDYVAVFIPGGHGAMLGLPKNTDVGKLIHWAHNKELFMLTICHGPAALLAANSGRNKNSFIYKGYSIAAFPDSVDKRTPLIGYMPGHMPWKLGERLKKLGVKIINTQADKTCHVDRKLITGASPKAANEFGKLAANELLKAIK